MLAIMWLPAARRVSKSAYALLRLGERVAREILCSTMSLLAELFDLERWASWFAELDRGFIFLLLLPFVVALIGIWAWFTEDDRK
jgi:hypothetical protein